VKRCGFLAAAAGGFAGAVRTARRLAGALARAVMRPADFDFDLAAALAMFPSPALWRLSMQYQTAD
jgi:hypothetical protein